jgi:hypothetical protein
MPCMNTRGMPQHTAPYVAAHYTMRLTLHNACASASPLRALPVPVALLLRMLCMQHSKLHVHAASADACVHTRAYCQSSCMCAHAAMPLGCGRTHLAVGACGRKHHGMAFHAFEVGRLEVGHDHHQPLLHLRLWNMLHEA